MLNKYKHCPMVCGKHCQDIASKFDLLKWGCILYSSASYILSKALNKILQNVLHKYCYHNIHQHKLCHQHKHDKEDGSHKGIETAVLHTVWLHKSSPYSSLLGTKQSPAIPNAPQLSPMHPQRHKKGNR
ncbi:hypothetical protein E2C01_032050 [Portunus trituberculatus]|uniref:Uncharacterized protein n=1 Tax=Portunus trituberculatus TaxID=210409 RepID=A0A5B7EV18_PORTR|nr:hypothetical protein [Portunus trituberculatus]